MTRFEGAERFSLDRQDKQLLVTHWSPYIVAQISLVPADGSARSRALSDTRTPVDKAMAWRAICRMYIAAFPIISARRESLPPVRHCVIDDNVLFEDSMRRCERLIER